MKNKKQVSIIWLLLIVLITNTCFGEIRIEDVEVVQTETQIEYSMSLNGSVDDLDSLPFKFELYESDVKISDSGWIDFSNENLIVENQVIDKTSSIEPVGIRAEWKRNDPVSTHQMLQQYSTNSPHQNTAKFYYDVSKNKKYFSINEGFGDYRIFSINSLTNTSEYVGFISQSNYRPSNYLSGDMVVCNGYFVFASVPWQGDKDHVIIKVFDGNTLNLVTEKRINTGTTNFDLYKVVLDSNHLEKNKVHITASSDRQIIILNISNAGQVSYSTQKTYTNERYSHIYTTKGRNITVSESREALTFYPINTTTNYIRKNFLYKVLGVLDIPDEDSIYLLTTMTTDSKDLVLRKLNLTNGEVTLVKDLQFQIPSTERAECLITKDSSNGNIFITGEGVLILNEHLNEIERISSDDCPYDLSRKLKSIHYSNQGGVILIPDIYSPNSDPNNYKLIYPWLDVAYGSTSVAGVRVDKNSKGLVNNNSAKSVKLDNGWIVVASRKNEDENKIHVYIDKHDGESFKQAFWIDVSEVKDWSIASIENSIAVLLNTETKLYFDKYNLLTVQKEGKTPANELDTQTSIESCSLTVSDSNDKIAAVWSFKNDVYAYSWSLRFSEGTIDSDKNIVWKDVEQPINNRFSGYNCNKPSVMYMSNNKPIIISEYTKSTPQSFQMTSFIKNDATWDMKSIAEETTYEQRNPAMDIGHNGQIAIAWQGKDNVDTYYHNIRYSESLDNGTTWATPVKLTSGNKLDSTNPNVISEANGNTRVLYSQNVNEKTLTYLMERVKTGDTFGNEATLIKSKSGNGQYVKSSEPGLTPLFIFEDYISNDVKFYGKWVDKVNVKYTFKDLNSSKKYKIKVYVKKKNGEILEYEKTADTKAVVPSLTLEDSTVTDSELIVKLSDTNSKDTTYKFYANDQYINIYGELDEGVENWYRVFENNEGLKTFTIRGLQSGKSYEIKVIAQNASGNYTSFSQPVSVTMKNTAPSGVVETINGVPMTNEIRLSWNAVEHATGYVVKVGDKTVEVEEPNVVLKTGLIDGLDVIPDIVYKVSVAAKNSISTTEFSLPASFKTLQAKPIAPVLSISSVTNHSIGLSWNEISGANKYELEVDGHLVDMNLDNIYVHKDLDKKSQHIYRIRCYNSDQMSDWSPVVVSMTTENDVRTELQSGVVAMTDDSVTISWNEVSNATAYYVQVNDGPIHKNGTYPYAVIGGLSPSTAYTFKVYAGDDLTHKTTPIVSITESTYALETPIINRISDEANFKVKWEAVHGATGYNVYLSTSETPILVTNTEYLIRLEDSVPLSNISVQAVNGDKLSGRSNVITILPRESVPTTPDKLGFISGEDYVLVTWDDVHISNDNIYYDIEVDGVIIEPLDRNKYYHDGLNSFTEHKYRIRSKSSMVNGLWSSFLRAITLPSKPLPPKDVVIKNGRSTATISWHSIPSAKGYDIKVNEDNQRIYSIGSQSEFIHRGIPLNQEQSYRIKTHNIIGESEWGNLIVNNSLRAICKREELLDLGLTASNIDDFSKYTLQATYNPDVLEVVDICGYTSEIELDVGLITGEDIEVTRFEEIFIDGIKTGIITFKVNKPVEEGYSWSGIVNNIKFKPRLSGATYLTYTVMIEE